MQRAHRRPEDWRTEVQPASSGFGPLLERDYWAVIADSQLRPTELAALVAERFPEFAPEDLVEFRRAAGETRPLAPGDVLDVRIRMAGWHRVVVVHRGPTSLTLMTLEGHPEAGRITFGAYRNDDGDVVFHIRSRARCASRRKYLGFLLGGNPMQTGTWAGFVSRVALAAGSGVAGAIHAMTHTAEEEDEDRGFSRAPTFIARSD